MIRITKHAQERMIERLKCQPHKLMKIAMKAYNSTEKYPIRYIGKTRGEYNSRYFGGHIYHFEEAPDGRVFLITMYNPKTKD